MKKRLQIRTIFIFGFVILILLSTSGCGKNEKAYDNVSTGEAAPEVSFSKPKEAVEEEIYYDEDKKTSDLENSQSVRKEIQNKFFVMETLEFDKTTKSVESLVSKYLGYVEGAEITGKEIYNTYSYNTRHAYYSLRIPSEKLNNFSEELKGLGNVVQERVNKEDVTAQYTDVTARIKSLKIQEERLLELVKKGTELKDILEIETQLSDVRYQIETYTATIVNIDNQVNYSTVQLELKEVIEVSTYEEPAVTVGQKISKGFLDSINDIKDFFVNLFIFIVVAIPYLVIFAVITIAMIIFFKKMSKKRKVKSANKDKVINTEVKSQQSEDTGTHSNQR
ncbi:MAG: hypothetical protein CVU84_05140 [Firmicutes bacterium HGW-Firmicutes-1]|jgi:hypothetical protein|nr:MAG: hypothetical protein CVU84_05140 [Firmicutes bacterium HGW-Firmicutes-1]